MYNPIVGRRVGYMIELPERILMVGAPGSKWSGVAQVLEEVLELNTSDRTPERQYVHNNFTGHLGAYFGHLMEFPAVYSLDVMDQPFTSLEGTRLIKSHDWALDLHKTLDFCKETKSGLFLTCRWDSQLYPWWMQAGGFDITYPSYEAYKTVGYYKNFQGFESVDTTEDIFRVMNSRTYKLAEMVRGAFLETFNSDFINKTFGVNVDIEAKPDVYVCYIPHKMII